MNKRLRNLGLKLAEKGLDAILITQPENRRWLSGFHGTAGYLIISRNKAILATDFRYTEQAAAEAPDFDIQRISGSLAEWFPGMMRDLAVKTLGFEGGDVTYDFHARLRGALRKKQVAVKLAATNNIVETLRAVKEPGEIELIRKASALTDAAFESVEKNIEAGMTEAQIAWELEKALREMGSQSLPFDIIVGSGPNAALPHAKPSGRPVQNGETIVIDMGGKVSGYASDLTRTVCAGKADAKLKKVYNTVLEAQTAAIAQIRKGMTGKEADAIAREVINQAGYGDAFGHSLGHGVGLAEHELPFLSPNSVEKLEENMVFTVEPGIYLTGWGGVRIEDTVVMEQGKVKLLTGARKVKYQ
ncbi:MAG: Xaa-Pro peptidase family protein [Dehalococcoidales bacterium]|jgi:Xaa-Pro aminopeptidase